MDAKRANRRLFRFGVFQADTGSGELLRNGKRLRVQQQPFRILTALLERPGEVVTREELRQTLWSGDTFVDFDDGLHAAVKKLRYALGDAADNPTFIETVPRRGYRFIAPVTVEEIAQAVVADAPSPPRQRTSRVAWLSGAAIVALVVAAGAVIAVKRSMNAPAAESAAIRSVVVLPLKNLSNDPEQQYFADGMTEELITRLASLDGLRVISRTSAMALRDSKKPLPQIAAELNVDGVIEGSVLRSGNRVRVTATLIHAASDRHIWAESFERDERDVLKLQNDVAEQIAGRISLRLRPGYVARRRDLAIDPEAHRAYLRGRYRWHTRRVDQMNLAIGDFERATTIEPDYALAYAGLADLHLVLPLLSNVPRDGEFRKARAAAEKALSKDSALAEAHTSIAYVNMWLEWNFADAEREFQKAIELNPNYATAHQWYAELLSLQGRHDEAVARIRTALQLDPLSGVMHHQAGEIYQFARRYDEAIQEYKDAIAIAPWFDRYSGWAMSFAFTKKGSLQVELERWKALRSARNEKAILEMERRAAANNRMAFVESRLVLYRLEVAKAWGDRPYYEAYFNAGAGRDSEALAWLNRAYEEHDEMVLRIHVDPEWDHLRSDPRFKAIAEKVEAALNVSS